MVLLGLSRSLYQSFQSQEKEQVLPKICYFSILKIRLQLSCCILHELKIGVDLLLFEYPKLEEFCLIASELFFYSEKVNLG